MLCSKISRKGQVTIPKVVRQCIRVSPGDLIEYEVQDDMVLIRRVEPFDRPFHTALQETLTEWSAPEDDQAFHDL